MYCMKNSQCLIVCFFKTSTIYIFADSTLTARGVATVVKSLPHKAK